MVLLPVPSAYANALATMTMKIVKISLQMPMGCP